MIVSFDYDTEYNGPSLPVVEVTLKNPVTDRATTVQGVLVDSGADGTIAPLRRLKQIQARRVDTVNMRPMRGPTFRVDLYEVELQIGVSLCVYNRRDTTDAEIRVESGRRRIMNCLTMEL